MSRQIVARLRSGEAVALVAAKTSIAEATSFLSVQVPQGLIDTGVIESIPSVEANELAAAHTRIAAVAADMGCR